MLVPNFLLGFYRGFFDVSIKVQKGKTVIIYYYQNSTVSREICVISSYLLSLFNIN